jgi:hypothetical protein
LSHPFTTSQPLSQLTEELDITGNTAGTTGQQGQQVGVGFTATATNNPSSYFFSTADANGDAGSDGGWNAFTDATTSNWATGQGIRVLTRGTKGQAGTLDGSDATPEAVTLEMTGVVNTGNLAIPLVTGGTGTTAGYNLVGNPYPSPVDIGAVLTAAGGNVGNAFYLRNPQTGAYITVSPIPASYIIPAHTAFFVKANAAANLNFTEAHKNVCSNCPQLFTARRMTNAIELDVLQQGTVVDQLLLAIGQDASQGSNMPEADKLMNDGFSLYAINAVGKKVAQTQIPFGTNRLALGIALPEAGGSQTYTLRVSQNSLAEGLMLQLYDKLTNTLTPLHSGATYSLQVNPADAAQTGDKRLEIRVGKK